MSQLIVVEKMEFDYFSPDIDEEMLEDSAEVRVCFIFEFC